jgi:electron transfer flavoprotein alpha subunit
MADILVYSEKNDTALELLSKGRELAGALGLGLSAAALGAGAPGNAASLGEYGAARVFVSEDAALDGLPVDVTADALAQIARSAEASYLLIGSTRRGKELAARLAQKLGAGCVTDVSSVAIENGELVANRYNFGGATVARETVGSAVKVFAVMPKAFELSFGAGAGVAQDAALTLVPSKVTVVERKAKESSGVDLGAAPRIVGVGRGFGKKDDLEMARELAKALEAEVGCTKGISDVQWLPEECILGLSGVKAKPDLYLALGLSGQIQHTVGISASKLIAAINTDKEAPIFQLADYGIVGDIYQVVPALLEKLKSL